MDPVRDPKVDRSTRWVALASALHGVGNVVALAAILRWWATPEQLGVATLAVSLFPALDAVADLGLGAAVVQGEAALDRVRLSGLFWLNLALAALLAGALLLLAPVLAAFHGEPQLAGLLGAYGLKLLLQGLGGVPEALLRRELAFATLSRLRIVGNLASFGLKIGLAAAGYPVWAFVIGPMARSAITTAGVLAVGRFRPVAPWRVAWRGLGADLRFGATSSASQALFYLYSNADYQIVGHVFGPAALGLYRAAYELVLEPVRFLADVTTQVAFPAFARVQAHRAALGAQLIAFTRQNLRLLGPFVAIVLAAAPELLAVMWPRYAAAAPMARLLCAVGLLRALSFVLPPLLDGTGAPAATLRYMALCTLLLPASFALAAHLGHGPEAVALAWALAYPLAFAVLLAMGLARTSLSLRDYLAGVASAFVPVLAAALAAFTVRALALELTASALLRLLATAAAIAVVSVVVTSPAKPVLS
jgi:teichuronic acid exporter